MPLDQAVVLRALVSDRAKLLAYIWSIVRDEHTVEDVFQEVSMLAVQKCAQITDEAALWPWLRQTAKFRSLHALRHRGKQVPLSEELMKQLDIAWQTHDWRSTSEIVDCLVHCMARLSPYAQRVVALRYVDGLSGIEVAARLQRETRTVYMALSRIHNSLRECIQRRLAALEAES